MSRFSIQHKRHHKRGDAELEITSFLNLMIILVPVLLVMMVFSSITVLDLKLPDLSADGSKSEDAKLKQLEIVLNPEAIVINYPAGFQLRRIPKQSDLYDFSTLSLTLQEIKRQLKVSGIEKRDAVILSRPTINYQTLVTTIDTVRSFKTVLIANVVDAELFPVISLGDAPIEASLSNSLSGKAGQ